MFFKQVKHWFVARSNAARWRPIQEWVVGRGGQFKLTRDGQGLVIELPEAAGGILRIDWGSSQRSYISGHELRIRSEAHLHPDLQMMVLCRQLMERLESSVFEAYTDTLKTRADTDTPEEMRWLVMFPKLAQFGSKHFKQRFGAIGVNKDLTAAWLEGPLSEQLVLFGQDLLPEGHPFVLMTMRGNVYLRSLMAEPQLAQIQGLVRLAELACGEAQRVNGRMSESGPWPTTTSIAWQASRPEDETGTAPGR